jgi:hypothetical protein
VPCSSTHPHHCHSAYPITFSMQPPRQTQIAAMSCRHFRSARFSPLLLHSASERFSVQQALFFLHALVHRHWILSCFETIFYHFKLWGSSLCAMRMFVTHSRTVVYVFLFCQTSEIYFPLHPEKCKLCCFRKLETSKLAEQKHETSNVDPRQVCFSHVTHV